MSNNKDSSHYFKLLFSMFQFPNLSQIPFPGKKTFNNMDRTVLEKRMKMLNSYMQIVLHLENKAYSALHDMLATFLEPEFDKSGPGGHFARTVSNLNYAFF